MTPAPRTSHRSPAARPVMIGTAIAGGTALAAACGSAAYATASTVASPGAETGYRTADAAGATALIVDVNAADVEVRFADVDEALLDLTGPRSDRWTLDRTGDALVVDSHERFWDFCFGWCRVGEQRVVLTLPVELEAASGTAAGDAPADGGSGSAPARAGLDASFSVAAGSLTATGGFGAVQVEMGAGRAVVEGSATAFDLEMGAGSSAVDLAGVTEASFEVAAGTSEARLTGEAPRAVDIEVSAGSLALELPDEEYRVSTETSAGSLDNGLRTSPASPRAVDVELSAGSVRLTPGA